MMRSVSLLISPIAFLGRGKSILDFSVHISGCSTKNFWSIPHRNIHIYSPIYQTSKSNLKKKVVLRTKMNYFVIGLSGVTCGGKTTLGKLLERSLPWCRVIYQDTYFYDDDYEHHIRMPDCENHVNYELPVALNMPKMHEDVEKILSEPGELHYDTNLNTNGDDTTPNWDTGMELLNNIKDINYDTSKYSKVPILIIEGFLMFASDILFDKCDARFFMTIPEEECRTRRTQRSYTPPDCPGYFDKAIWPEYVKHFNQFIDKRPGVKVFNGTDPIEDIWKESLDIITCRLEEKCFPRKA